MSSPRIDDVEIVRTSDTSSEDGSPQASFAASPPPWPHSSAANRSYRSQRRPDRRIATRRRRGRAVDLALRSLPCPVSRKRASSRLQLLSHRFRHSLDIRYHYLSLHGNEASLAVLFPVRLTTQLLLSESLRFSCPSGLFLLPSLLHALVVINSFSQEIFVPITRCGKFFCQFLRRMLEIESFMPSNVAFLSEALTTFPLPFPFLPISVEFDIIFFHIGKFALKSSVLPL